MSKIIIRKTEEEKIKNFAKTQWAIVNKRFGFLPAKKTFFFAIYYEKKLIGYAKVDIRGGLAEVRDLLIHDKFTGKGIGSKAIDYIEKWARKNKCRKVVIKTASRFTKTVNFYKKHNYRIDAILPNYYYGCDWYYMVKEL